METTTFAALLVGLLIGLLVGAPVAVLWLRSRPEHHAALGQGLVDQAEVMQSLDRLSDQLHELDRERSRWHGRLHEQVHDMRASTESLRRETQSLATALRKPQVRGRWGELHLRRTVELAGLVDRCDFGEQVRLDDGARRPDLVVHLAGGRQVVVDAKVPLDAFLDATQADDETAREQHLARHARQLRTHVDGLAAKAYWRSLGITPEFAVLFVPAEAFLSAALEADAGLLEHAAARNVVLASPTTLIALLRTVAQGWSHQALSEQAEQVHVLGRELHARLGVFAGHLDRVGRSLNTATEHYNKAVGSLESRVLVEARRFGELGVTGTGQAPLETPRRAELRAVERDVPRRGADDEPEGRPTVAM